MIESYCLVCGLFVAADSDPYLLTRQELDHSCLWVAESWAKRLERRWQYNDLQGYLGRSHWRSRLFRLIREHITNTCLGVLGNTICVGRKQQSP